MIGRARGLTITCGARDRYRRGGIGGETSRDPLPDPIGGAIAGDIDRECGDRLAKRAQFGLALVATCGEMLRHRARVLAVEGAERFERQKLF